MSRTLLAFGDVHIPYHHPAAVEVLCRAAEHIHPDIIICLGDLLDCHQFSSHPPTYGIPETEYARDLACANALLDRLQQASRQLVILEGNHEYRLDRWAAATTEGRGAYSLLAPRLQLTRNRDCIYIPYGSTRGRYPHYPINRRIVAVHGWSYARHATRIHLMMAQGRSVIHGHTHRAETVAIQGLWRPSHIVEARSAGCLCQLVPLYGAGRPVEWVHGFIIGFLGRRSDTLYTVFIRGTRCILPDGTEIAT